MIINMTINVTVDDHYADDDRSQQARLDAAMICARSCAKVLLKRLQEYGLRGELCTDFDVKFAERFDTEVF